MGKLPAGYWAKAWYGQLNHYWLRGEKETTLCGKTEMWSHRGDVEGMYRAVKQCPRCEAKIEKLRKEKELEESNGGDSTTMAPEGDDCKSTSEDAAIGERVQG